MSDTNSNDHVSHGNKRKKKSHKSARLVIRNLPFSCKEDDVRDYFSVYGRIKEVTLLRKNDRLVGCGFVQFSGKLQASVAMNSTNGQMFQGRPIVVDWAVPKSRFRRICIKKDNLTADNIKNENEDTADEKHMISEESAEKQDDKNSFSSSTDHNESKDKNIKKTRRDFNDEDMCETTVFFKSIPFQATNDDLKKSAEESAGPVEYALINFDSLTEHSKGTGFVRFKDKTVAEQVLNNEKKLIIFGKPLLPFKVLQKEELIKSSSKPKFKDKRNLYLIKEGVILAGSSAAKGVSQSDMNKRLLLEQEKSKLLKNLHKFISPTRLVIYNLPIYNFDNKKLLTLFKTYSPPNAFINEARVMRNLKDLDDKGVPKSKGFGFVSFTKHEDALAALRAINNNPNIFSDKKRPIVSFSVEDKLALLIKKKREEKAKLKSSNQEKHLTDKVNERKSQKIINKLSNKIKNQKRLNKNFDENYDNKTCASSSSSTAHQTSNFAGITSKPGIKKLPSKKKLIKQATVHKMNLKKDKLKKKIANKRISRKQKRLKKQMNKYE